jgi:enolase-phosphatase E1
MIEFQGRLLLLDIEGTVSNLAFVHETLFPYARKEAGEFLSKNSGRPEVRAALEQMARDAGADSFATWCPHPDGSPAAVEWVIARVHALMDADAKQTGLKQLQGMIWARGYQEGLLKAHLFPDVPPALASWKRAGLGVRIYSSGSVAAQKLFFRFSVAGDLTSLLDGFYDTTTGPKREVQSYRAITSDTGLAPDQILFLSDVPAELDAAAAAGMKTALVVRPGNHPSDDSRHPRIGSLDQIRISQ